MKTSRTLLTVAAMLVGISTFSQAQEHAAWKVDVPFDFTVRHTHLHAGRYTVKESGRFVMLTSQGGKTGTVLVNPDSIAKPAKESSLTFKMEDGAYDLKQIKNYGSNSALNTVVSKRAPKRLEAAIGPQTVEVAAVGTR